MSWKDFKESVKVFLCGREAANGRDDMAHPGIKKQKSSFFGTTEVQKARLAENPNYFETKRYGMFEETPVQQARRQQGERLGERKNKKKWYEESEVQKMRRLQGEKLGR